MRVLVTGGGGAIGSHLVKRLVADGHKVVAVDVKELDDWWLSPTGEVEEWDCFDLAKEADKYIAGVLTGCDLVFHLAASMGGLGFLADKANDQAVLLGNTLIDLRVMHEAVRSYVKRFIYSSSACVYPEHRQLVTNAAPLREDEAYPAGPDLEYGWQKLYSERLLAASGLNGLAVRFHNVYGPHGSWRDGREKAPAAMCRKVAEAKLRGEHKVEVWGDGQQRRSFMYVDDCVEGLIRLAATDETEPINLGSDESISIDGLAHLVAKIADWPIEIVHVPGPEGVRGRNSDNRRLKRVLGWSPPTSLEEGLRLTFPWISEEVRKAAK